jgi:hypothetical protein
MLWLTKRIVRPSPANFAHLAQTLLLKFQIAYGQDFIDYQISGSRCAATAKGQTHIHAR